MKLKEYRKLKGWKQRDVAGMLSVSKEFVSQIERGVKRPSPKLAQKIEILTDGAVPFKAQLLSQD